jgi:hypothetical protein
LILIIFEVQVVRSPSGFPHVPPEQGKGGAEQSQMLDDNEKDCACYKSG